MGQSRAVLINPYRDWSTNEHEAAISERLADLGYRVMWMACTGDLVACDRYWFNAHQRRRTARDCENCQTWCQGQEAKLTGERITLGEFLTDDDRREITAWASDIPMSEWVSATFDGLPVGWWATSSIGTHLRELPVRVDDWNGLSVARDVLHATATSMRAAQRLVTQIKPELMVVFNGRFSSTRPFLEIARSAGIPVIGHESGDRTRDDCRLMPGYGVGDRGYWDTLARRARTRPLSVIEAKAVNDWIVRRFHDPTLPIRYASPDAVPESPWPIGSPRVLVVPSSSDEIIELDGWDRPSFGSLQNVLAWVASCAKADPSASVVVRAHPNLQFDKMWGPSLAGVQQFKEFAQSAPSNVRVIQPGEKASTYSYLRGADLVITDFSLMGLEAAALGIPALVVGHPRYWQAGCVQPVDSTVSTWRALESEARRAVSQTTIARARRCMWNLYFGAELPVAQGEDKLGRQTLADAIERWVKTGSLGWDDLPVNKDSETPLPHEVVDLWSAIEQARGTFMATDKRPKNYPLVSKVVGASNRLRRAARVLVRGV